MKRSLSSLILTLIFVAMHSPALAQDLTRWQTNLTQPQDYVLKRVSSADPSGGNADFRPIEPGGTLTVLSSTSVTVHSPEKGDVSCTVGSSTPPLGDFHVGDHVGMACVDGVVAKLVRL